MVVVNIPDKIIQYLVNGIDSLIKNYDVYQMTMDDVVNAANFSTFLQKSRERAVDSNAQIDSEDEKYDVNMDENAKMPNHRFVVGKGWIKNK